MTFAHFFWLLANAGHPGGGLDGALEGLGPEVKSDNLCQSEEISYREHVEKVFADKLCRGKVPANYK